MTVWALIRARIANHWGNTAVVAFLCESISWCRTNCHACRVWFVVCIKIRSIGRICIIIGFAACTVIYVPDTRDTERITISAVCFIYGVAHSDLYIQLVLSQWAVTLTHKSIRPLIILICAKSTVSVWRPKAFHATLITESAEIGLSPIIICRIRKRRFIITGIIVPYCVILVSIKCACIDGNILSKKLIDRISWQSIIVSQIRASIDWEVEIGRTSIQAVSVINPASLATTD